MYLTPIFRGEVIAGRLVIHSRLKMQQWIEKLKGEVEITIKKKRKPRSANANAYYWGVVLPIIADEIGASCEEVHDTMKARYANIIKTVKGKQIRIIRSTAGMNSMDFGEFVDKVIIFATTELNCLIPEPNTTSI